MGENLMDYTLDQFTSDFQTIETLINNYAAADFNNLKGILSDPLKTDAEKNAAIVSYREVEKQAIIYSCDTVIQQKKDSNDSTAVKVIQKLIRTCFSLSAV